MVTVALLGGGTGVTAGLKTMIRTKRSVCQFLTARYSKRLFLPSPRCGRYGERAGVRGF
jgi:hypothetical protein